MVTKMFSIKFCISWTPSHLFWCPYPAGMTTLKANPTFRVFDKIRVRVAVTKWPISRPRGKIDKNNMVTKMFSIKFCVFWTPGTWIWSPIRSGIVSQSRMRLKFRDRGSTSVGKRSTIVKLWTPILGPIVHETQPQGYQKMQNFTLNIFVTMLLLSILALDGDIGHFLTGSQVRDLT